MLINDEQSFLQWYSTWDEIVKLKYFLPIGYFCRAHGQGIDFLFARSALNENESFEIGQKEKWLIFIFMSVKIHNCSRFNIR